MTYTFDELYDRNEKLQPIETTEDIVQVSITCGYNIGMLKSIEKFGDAPLQPRLYGLAVGIANIIESERLNCTDDKLLKEIIVEVLERAVELGFVYTRTELAERLQAIYSHVRQN